MKIYCRILLATLKNIYRFTVSRARLTCFFLASEWDTVLLVSVWDTFYWRRSGTVFYWRQSGTMFYGWDHVLMVLQTGQC